MKIAINGCFGGFSLSKEAYEYLGKEWDGWGYAFNNCRTNPKLIECIETLSSKKASGFAASVKIVDVPDDVDWEITEYDGMEQVEEKHRVWY